MKPPDFFWITNMAREIEEMLSKWKKVEEILITYILTNKCTLKCRHCFEEAGPENSNFLSLESIIKISENLKPAFDSLNNDSRKISFQLRITGGDPFLHPQFYDIINYFGENKEKIGFSVSDVETNGWWASSDSEAYNIIKKVKDAKASKISMTNDKFHRENAKFNVNEHGQRIQKISKELEMPFRYITSLVPMMENATPIGRARFEVDEKNWFTGWPAHCALSKERTAKDGYYISDSYLLKNTHYHINPSGDIFLCESGKRFKNASLSLGNINEKLFSEIISNDTPVIKSLKENGIKGLYNHFGFSEEHYENNLKRFGYCGSCHELLRNL